MEDTYQEYYCSNSYDVCVNEYGVKSGTSLRFLGNRGLVSKTDTYGWFQWYFRYFLVWRLSDDER